MAKMVEAPVLDSGDTGAPDGVDPGAAAGRGRSWLVDAAILAGLAVAFVTLFVLLRVPPFHYDPIEYFSAAQGFETLRPFHRTLRIGLLGPVRLAQVVFGYSQAAYYTVPLASGLLLLGSTYALGRTLSSRWVGAAAATLVTFTVPVFSSVHQLWPDLPATAVFTAGMAATTALCKRQGVRGDDAAPGPWVYAGFLAAGTIIGASYLVREFTVVLFPVVLLPFWQYRTPWRYVLVGAGGALAALGVELAFNARFHGDPFVRIRDLVNPLDEPPAPHVLDLHVARTAERGGFLERLAVFPEHLLSGRAPLLAGVGALALVSPFLTRGRERRGVLAMLGWILFYWAFVLYLSLDVDEYGRALHIEKMRYWYPVLPPLVVAGCIGGAAAVRRLGGQRLRQVAGGVLGLVIVLGITTELVGQVEARGVSEPHRYEQVRRWLATEGADIDSLATTQRTRWITRMFTRSPFGDTVWEGRTEAVNTARRFRAEDEVDADLLLVDDTFFEARRSNWREVTPDWLLDLPDHWSPVAASDDGELVVYERLDEARPRSPVAADWSSQDDVVVVGDTGGATVALDRGQRATVSLVATDDATTGSVVLVESEIDAAGAGNVVPFCFMVDADGTRVRSDASSLWGVGFEEARRVQAACTVPVALTPPVSVRLGMTVVGPVDVDLGPAVQLTVPTTTSWRLPD